MKSLIMLLLFSWTICAIPPGGVVWGSPCPEKETPTKEKDPNKEMQKVHSVSVQEIKNRIHAGCIEQVSILRDADAEKHERDLARWRLANFKNHPFYDEGECRSANVGCFPHSGNTSY